MRPLSVIISPGSVEALSNSHVGSAPPDANAEASAAGVAGTGAGGPQPPQCSTASKRRRSLVAGAPAARQPTRAAQGASPWMVEHSLGFTARVSIAQSTQCGGSVGGAVAPPHDVRRARPQQTTGHPPPRVASMRVACEIGGQRPGARLREHAGLVPACPPPPGPPANAAVYWRGLRSWRAAQVLQDEGDLLGPNKYGEDGPSALLSGGEETRSKSSPCTAEIGAEPGRLRCSVQPRAPPAATWPRRLRHGAAAQNMRP